MVIGDGVVEREEVVGFDEFFVLAEPRLRRALVARHGAEYGREATIDALTYGWRHWARVGEMDNPLGYLYRVGTNSVRRGPVLIELDPDAVASTVDRDPWVEPRLHVGLDTLSEPQRMAVVLRHGLEWTLVEIAELLDMSVRSVRTHLDRGMAKLRTTLEVSDG